MSGSIYPERPRFATKWPTLQMGLCTSLSRLELSIALNEFFCPAPGKTDGNAAVFLIALDPYNRADAEVRMADFAAQHGIGIGATPHS